MKSFKGATVLVTGASSGIGEAFARNLANRGANLILTARSEDKLSQIAKELSEKHAIRVHVFPWRSQSAGYAATFMGRDSICIALRRCADK